MRKKHSKSDRQKRLEKHHGIQKRVKLQRNIAILGSVLVLSIPVYIIYFT